MVLQKAECSWQGGLGWLEEVAINSTPLLDGGCEKENKLVGWRSEKLKEAAERVKEICWDWVVNCEVPWLSPSFKYRVEGGLHMVLGPLLLFWSTPRGRANTAVDGEAMENGVVW